jgi:hypothetical protein
VSPAGGGGPGGGPGGGAPVVAGSAAIQLTVDSSGIAATIQNQIAAPIKQVSSAWYEAGLSQTQFEAQVSAAAKSIGDEVDRNTASVGTFGSTGKEAFSAVGQAIGLSGGAFAPLQQAVTVFGTSTAGVTEQWAAMPGVIGKSGVALMTVGGAMTAIGGIAIEVGKGQEEASATLDQALENNNTSYAAHRDQIEQTIQAEENHAHSAADTETALARLTAAEGYDTASSQGMAMADAIAARNKVSLANAANQAIMIMAGKGGRAATQWNIDVTAAAKADKAATDAAKAHQSALDELAKAQQSAGDVAAVQAARGGAAAAKQADNTRAVADAEANLVQANQALAALPTDLAEKQTTAYDDWQNAVVGVVDAAYKVVDAEKAVADMGANEATAATNAYIAWQQAILNTSDATDKLTAAEQALQDIQTPPATTIAAAEEAIGKARIGRAKAAQTLADAELKLQAAQASGDPAAVAAANLDVQSARYGAIDAANAEAAAEAALQKIRDDAQPGSAAMTQAENALQAARLAVQKATLDQATAEQASAQATADAQPGSEAQIKLVDALASASIAEQGALLKQTQAQRASAQATADALPGSQAYQDALRKVADAEDAVTKARQSGQPSAVSEVTAGIASTNAAEKVADAQAKVKETTDALTKANADKAAADAKGTAAQQLLTKAHELADAQAKTLSGRMDALKTKVLDWAGSLSNKAAPALISAGPLIMGIGAIIQSQLIPKIAVATASIVVWGAKTAVTLAGMMGEAAGTAAAWVADMAAMLGSTVTTMTGINISTGGLFLVLGAIVVGIYELATHWSTVWSTIKNVVKDAVDWIRDHLTLLIVSSGPIGLLIAGIDYLAHHWSDVWRDIQGVVKGFVDFITGIPDAIGKALDQVGGFFSKLKDDITNPLGDVTKVISALPFVPHSPPPMVTWAQQTVEGVNDAFAGIAMPDVPAIALPNAATGTSTATTTTTTSNVTIAPGAIVIQVGSSTADVQQIRAAGDELLQELATLLRARGV